MALNTYNPDPNRIVHNTGVDFNSRPSLYEPVHLVQYDSKLPIIAVKMYNNGSQYAAPAGAVANIRVGKQNYHYVIAEALGCSSDRTVVYFEVSQQMVTDVGPTFPVVEIIVNGRTAASSQITMIVDKNPVSQAAVESSDEYKALTEYEEQAKLYAQNAQTSADSASSSAFSAQASSVSAQTSALAASGSASNAASSAKAADNSANEAKKSQASAASSASAASASQLDAATSASNASISALQAATSAEIAANSQTAAKSSETNASKSASEASDSAKAAAASQSAAATSASSASTSASSAQTSATDASKSKDAAAASAKAAATSETNAHNSEVSALESKNAAATSATNAASSASSASSSAASALSSKESAATSAAEALSSEQNAAASEANAKEYETNAKNSADAAALSESNAAASAEIAKQYSGNTPIVGENNNWWTWNADTGEYEDTGNRSILAYDISYPSVAEMQADAENQKTNTVAIISSNVEEEDNAKLFIKSSDGTWHFLADLSGYTGNGILNIELIEGEHTAGTFDTYRVTYTDGRTYEYKIWNGVDGGGDMLAYIYDTEGKHTNIFKYVDTSVADVSNSIVTFEPLEERANIESGDSLSTALSKVAKAYDDLSNVAFTGSYNDLVDIPPIPDPPNDGTLTIKQNGEIIGTFSANQEDSIEIDLTDNNTEYDIFTNESSGLVPSPGTENSNRFLREDGEWIVPTDTNTTYNVMTGASDSDPGSSGLVPQPGTGTNNRYLRSDGEWAVPPDTNTTYNVMQGATATTNGVTGLVPVPTSGQANRYLRSDGQWAVPPDNNTTYSNFNKTTPGLVPAPTGTTSTRFLREDGSWVVPTDTNTTYGTFTKTVSGLVPAPTGSTSTRYLREDGSWVVPTDTNTTYSAFNRSYTGLVPAPGGSSTTRYLCESGGWAVPPNTTYGNVTRGAAGLAPAPGGSTLTRYLREDSTWQVPPNTTYGNATRNAAGLVPAPGGSTTTRYLREDLTWQVPPNTDTNTTYSAFNRTYTGLVPAPGGSTVTRFLREDSTWQVPPYLPTAGGVMTGEILMSIGLRVYWNQSNASIKSKKVQELTLRASAEENYALYYGVVDGVWSLCPYVNGNTALGTASRRFVQMYLNNAPNVSSDRNLKKNITKLIEGDKYDKLFDLLKPVSFQFTRKESDRIHTGFIAQDVKEAMDEVGLSDMDFAGYCKDEKWEGYTDENGEEQQRKVLDENGDPIYIYSLRYSDFISLNTMEIQELKKKLKEDNEKIVKLTETVNTLSSKIEELMTKINALEEKT